MLWEESQAYSKQQPPKVRGTGPKDPAKSRPKPGGKAVTEMAAHACGTRCSTGQGAEEEKTDQSREAN